MLNGYKFRGKHATYVKFLAKSANRELDNGINIFNRNLDLYMFAAIIGVRYERRATVDNSVADTVDIAKEQMLGNAELTYLYRLVMLCDESKYPSKEDRVDRAFKSDFSESKKNENIELFNQYVLGGVEMLYERFKDSNGNESEVWNNIIELVGEFDKSDLLG